MSSSMLWRRWPSPSVTPNELLEILTAHTAGYYVLPAEPNNEVFPGVYLGDSTTALCLHLLRALGITHVLNAACGKNRNYGMVNTGAGYYRNAGITFMGIEALDVAVYPLFQHFQVASEFIEDALAISGGRVLVHCGEGISRSSTLVIAWLMLKRGYPLKEAVKQVVKHRNILPNQGFLLQLCQLHDQIVGGTVPNEKKKVKAEAVPAAAVQGNSRSTSVSPMPSDWHRQNFLSPSPSPFSSSSNSSTSPSPLPAFSSSSSREFDRALPSAYDRHRFRRAPSPSPTFGRTSWSNGWTPPPPVTTSSSSSSFAYSRHRSPSPVRRSGGYLASNSPSWSLYGSAAAKGSSSSSYLSPTRSAARSGLRCQSVDRDFGGGGSGSGLYSSGSSSSIFSRPHYSGGSNLLMSSYLSPSRPSYFATTIR